MQIHCWWKTSAPWPNCCGRGLTEEGHQTALAHDGLAGLEMAQTNSFDVIVLDMMLPRPRWHRRGPAFARGRNQTPILMLTAKTLPPTSSRASMRERTITSPAFSFEILLARLRAVSRRGAIPAPSAWKQPT